METDLSGYFTRPTPLVVIAATAPKRGRRTAQQDEKKEVTEHREGGPVITNPTHGKSGWFQGILVIFDNRHGTETGWYTLLDFQKLKVLSTGRPDFRIMPADHYAGNRTLGGYVSPPPFEYHALFHRHGRVPFHHRAGRRVFI